MRSARPADATASRSIAGSPFDRIPVLNPRAAQRIEGRRHLGIGGEVAVGLEEGAAAAPVDRRAAREGIVEGPLGEEPERLVAPGEREDPGVFELLRPPDLRQPRRFRPDRRMARDGRVHVEEGAVGIEENRSGATQDRDRGASGTGRRPDPRIGSARP